MYVNIAIVAILVFIYSIMSGRLEKTFFSGAILFTAFGIVFGPLALKVVDLPYDTDLLRTLAELNLALILFTDAASAASKFIEWQLQSRYIIAMTLR